MFQGKDNRPLAEQSHYFYPGSQLVSSANISVNFGVLYIRSRFAELLLNHNLGYHLEIDPVGEYRQLSLLLKLHEGQGAE